MEFNGIRLLVKDFDACFNFYSQKLKLNVTWGKKGGDYASFDIGLPSILSIYKSDLMANVIGNPKLQLPLNYREKSVIVIKVSNVDKVFEDLKANNITFINSPTNMSGWGMRAVHLYDPERNLIELWSELAKDKWDKNLIEEAKEFE